MSLADTGDPIWDDRRSPAEIWRNSWAERAVQLGSDHFVVTHAQVYALGYSRAQLRSRLRRQIWWAPRTSVVALFHPGDDARVARALSGAAAALTHRGSVVSHESAAVLHGLPVLADPEVPLVTGSVRHGSRHAVHVHLTAVDLIERVEWHGTLVTSVARTVIDIARSGGLMAGMVTADAALREGLISAADLGVAVAAACGRPGNVAARWVAERADPGSESPLESVVRCCLLQAGLPSPRLQVWIPEAVARVDMLFPERRVVLEADGMLKYIDTAALRDEKRRQERLERAGYRVVRVTWHDVMRRPGETIVRVRRALDG